MLYRVLSWIRRWLEHPRAPLGVVGLALALVGVSVSNGLTMDDHIHRLMVTGQHSFGFLMVPPWDLFALVPSDPALQQEMAELGLAPWWGQPGMQIIFWRPLSSISHAVDYSLWPGQPWLMHVHNLLWMAALLWSVHLIYRRLIGPRWVAVLATALYALDDARIAPVSWIANRNLLIATCLSVLALLAHHRWRAEQWRPGAWLAPMALGAAVLSAELAVGVLAYLLAYALCLDRGSWRARVASLLPSTLVLVAWQLAYRALGYGVVGSAYYLDPARSPGEFLVAVGERAPLLWLGQFALPSAELNVLLSPGAKLAHLAVALVVVALVATVLWPLLRRDRLARFWALGLVLATIPACATFPHDRLTCLSGLGAMGLIAQLLASMVSHDGSAQAAPRPARMTRLVGAAFVAIHLVLTPLGLPWRATFIGQLGRMMERATLSIPNAPELSEQTLVIVNAPNMFLGSFLPLWRTSLGVHVPARTRCLGVSLEPVRISRLDDRTLRLEPRGGYLRTMESALVRPADTPFHRGQRIDRVEPVIEIVEIASDGRPAVVQVQFEQSLDHRSLRWVTWQGRGFVPFEVPPVGQAVVLERIDGLELLTGQ